MIGEKREDLETNGLPRWAIPIRDAIITFCIVFLSNLVTKPDYPPEPSLLYASILSALLIALVSYAHSVGIKLERGKQQ